MTLTFQNFPIMLTHHQRLPSSFIPCSTPSSPPFSYFSSSYTNSSFSYSSAASASSIKRVGSYLKSQAPVLRIPFPFFFYNSFFFCSAYFYFLILLSSFHFIKTSKVTKGPEINKIITSLVLAHQLVPLRVNFLLDWYLIGFNFILACFVLFKNVSRR